MLHLLHPAFVHFATAFLVAGGIGEALAIALGRERIERFCGVLVASGTLVLVPTVLTGFLAENSIDVAASALPLLSRHELVGIGILALFLVSQLWKAWHRGALPAAQRPAYAGLLLLAVALTCYGALLGGEMVYVHAVGVRAGT